MSLNQSLCISESPKCHLSKFVYLGVPKCNLIEVCVSQSLKASLKQSCVSVVFRNFF